MKKIFTLLVLFPTVSFCAMQVATTTEDLAYLVSAVGNDDVEVFSISRGNQDVHQIEAKPSYMIKLNKSDLVISHGLELEDAWLNPLITGARNPKLKTSVGHLELGPELNPIEVQIGPISRKNGDLHGQGNPHFQLDPIRMGQAALIIAKRLSTIQPEHKADFLMRAENLKKQLDQKTTAWIERIKKTEVKEVVTYHKTFSYFCVRFDLVCELQIETKPGIPPTATHLVKLIKEIKDRNVKIVLVENYFNNSAALKIKEQVPKVKIIQIPVSVKGDSNIKDSFMLIENIVAAIESNKK